VPNPNPEEVEDWKYVDMDWLNKDVKENPNDYTVWFKIALKEVKQHIESGKAV
jgi:isopentenyl-diphosphate delta-isomerase